MNTLDAELFDLQRQEWQFEVLREVHEHCCAGALLWGGAWVNVICPVYSESGERVDRPWRDGSS